MAVTQAQSERSLSLPPDGGQAGGGAISHARIPAQPTTAVPRVSLPVKVFYGIGTVALASKTWRSARC